MTEPIDPPPIFTPFETATAGTVPAAPEPPVPPEPPEPPEPPVPPLQPIADQERIVTWDLFRGIAVMGILLANMPYMSLAEALVDDMMVRGDPADVLDRLAYRLVFVLVDTKFVTAFSLLFGAGLALLHHKVTAHGRRFGKVGSRRLLGLLAFGILHGTLLWFGDILTSYAVLGLVALAFLRRRPKTLVVWASVLLVLNLAIMTGLAALDPDELVELQKGADGQTLSAAESIALTQSEYREVFASGDFARMLGPRCELYVLSSSAVLLLAGLRTLALFLLGMVLVRTRALVDIGAHRRAWIWLAGIGLGCGLPLHLISLAMDETTARGRMLAMLALYVGGLVLCAGYLGATALWSLGSRARALQLRLAAVGRMAFTNYIAQSALTALLFNYLGYFDRVTGWQGLLVAAAILALQLWWSPLWLRRFRMGPLEWLWRTLTYWRATPLCRTVAPADCA